MKSQNKNSAIDLGLAVLCVVLEPGETMPLADVADVCSCSKDSIYQIERRVIKKVRSRLNLHEHLGG